MMSSLPQEDKIHPRMLLNHHQSLKCQSHAEFYGKAGGNSFPRLCVDLCSCSSKFYPELNKRLSGKQPPLLMQWTGQEHTCVYTYIHTGSHKQAAAEVKSLGFFKLFFFFFFFNMDHFFKAFIEMVTISLLFYVLVFGPIACGIIAPWQGIEPTPTPSIGRWRLNHWDHQGSPWNFCLENTFFQSNQGLQRGNFA